MRRLLRGAAWLGLALGLWGFVVEPNRLVVMVQEDGRQLFVSTGIGTSIVPVRLGVPPETSVLQILPPATTFHSTRP